MNVPRWLLFAPPLAAIGLVLLACGGGGAPTGGDALPGLDARVPVTGLAFPLAPASPEPLDAVRAFPALSFERPVLLTHAPDGTDRVFVVEQAGRILVFENRDDVAPGDVRTFLDLTARVSRAGNEEGLLGLAFDPDYATTGRFWVHHSAASPRRSVIARYRVSASDPEDADEASEAIVLTVPQPYDNHNGGTLAFGPDGMLYIGLGDGGAAGDPLGNGQSLTTLLGKVLRLDVRDAGVPYRVPADNPFIARGGGARGEIWAYGLRNPWRFSFDRLLGTLWLGDVGQGAREEIDIVVRGANHGWRGLEGNLVFDGAIGSPPDHVPPVRDYAREEGTCVIGGHVYRGTLVPSLRGAYLHGDHGSGRIWALVHDGGRVVENAWVATVPGVASFGEDREGEVYAVSLSGGIYRFAERTPGTAPAFPARLSETGLFADTAGLVAAPGLVPYDVNAPLWSDGANKRRWIALPGAERIGFAAAGPWTFPRGTVLVKHFEIPTSPGVVRRLETRVLVLETTGWAGYTYRWNDAQTDADLLPGALSETIFVSEGGGPPVPRRWDYPSRTDCLRCHTDAAGRVLGVRTVQLNRDFDYALRRANQLSTWDHIGLFDRDIGAAGAHGALASPGDLAESAASRARAYLDANCAMCHQPGGATPVDLDLRHDVALASMRLLDVPPTEGDLGLADAARVRAGRPEASVLWERMRRTDNVRMPPLASHVVDDDAVALVAAWIEGL